VCLPDEIRRDSDYYTSCRRKGTLLRLCQHDEKPTYVNSIHHQCETVHALQTRGLWVRLFTSHRTGTCNPVRVNRASRSRSRVGDELVLSLERGRRVQRRRQAEGKEEGWNNERRARSEHTGRGQAQRKQTCRRAGQDPPLLCCLRGDECPVSLCLPRPVCSMRAQSVRVTSWKNISEASDMNMSPSLS